MKLKTILISLSLATTLVACNSGSGSSGGSSNTNPPTNDTYSDVTVNTSSVGTIQAVGTSGSTNGSYLATPSGVYSVTPNTTQSRTLEKGSTLTQISTNSGVFNISGLNNNLYYSTTTNIFSYDGNNSTSVFVLPTNQGQLTALSQPSSNGSLYYGTSLGFVGLSNNPADKQINQITGQGGVLAIGCIANGSCNSGKQGIMALTLTSGDIDGLPPFESSNTAAQWSYPTAFSYYNIGDRGQSEWITPPYDATLASNITKAYFTSSNNPGIQGTNATESGTASVNEFVTAVTFNGGNIYVGTNLFNIYVARNYTCNNGQAKQPGGCAVNFTGPINKTNDGVVTPLGWLQTSVDGNPDDGSVGISYLAVQSSGQLLAVAQESSTYATVYTSASTSY